MGQKQQLGCYYWLMGKERCKRKDVTLKTTNLGDQYVSLAYWLLLPFAWHEYFVLLFNNSRTGEVLNGPIERMD